MKNFLIILCAFQICYGHIDKTWWKHTILYEIFLQSFKDGNGDGIGDIKGLISKLDHFVDLGIETVYISPHYESPMVDSGYDVANFTNVNPMFGTMQDFDTLIKQMKKRKLKLMIDMVINHSSDKNPWFAKSINKEDPYTDYYVWKDPKGYDLNGKPIPPNNWVSIFSGPAWTWNAKRKQFYFHQFSPEQPDFNFRNDLLKDEIKKIFKFWFDKGVAGFRLDAVKFLMEDALFRDEPVSSPEITVPYKDSDVIHIHTRSLWESYEILHELRTYTEEITKKFKDYERILTSESYHKSKKFLYQYYGSENYRIMHFPFNFALVLSAQYENATFFHDKINEYLEGLPEEATPCWNSENHDKLRKGTLLNEEYGFIFTTMVMMLPGVAYLYYGQEIGLSGSKIRPDQIVNKFEDEFTKTGRDSSRQPMLWDDTLNAGFSNNRVPFLPVNPNYWRINADTQKNTENSYYNMFKKMSKLRKTSTIKHGDFKSYVFSQCVFGFTRSLKGRETYVTIFNLGSETEFVDVHNTVENLPKFLTIEMASPNSGLSVGKKLPSAQRIPKILILRPSTVVILSTKVPAK
ncbi:alpha-glucosidase-like [Planococcus citri]|uniref:alpha-glucosidase-like n=1 Tax=Planococcus citri TaxID=170843 RepID=UPI0031F9028C